MTTILNKVRGNLPKEKAVEKPVVETEGNRAVSETSVSEAVVGVKSIASAEAIAHRNRRTRSPVNGRRNILTVKGLAPGMVGRWVDNDPDRVAQLTEQGYEPVRKPVQVGDISIDSGKPMGAVVTKRVGGGKEAILMQIPKEWYDADQKEKQRIVDERELAIRAQGEATGQYGGVTLADIVPGRKPKVRGSEDE